MYLVLYNTGDTSRFVCSPEQSVTLDKLCDGTADCSNGNDETTAICESKLVIDHYLYNNKCTYSYLSRVVRYKYMHSRTGS